MAAFAIWAERMTYLGMSFSSSQRVLLPQRAPWSPSTCASRLFEFSVLQPNAAAEEEAPPKPRRRFCDCAASHSLAGRFRPNTLPVKGDGTSVEIVAIVGAFEARRD